jgi:hypothetical protein
MSPLQGAVPRFGLLPIGRRLPAADIADQWDSMHRQYASIESLGAGGSDIDLSIHTASGAAEAVVPSTDSTHLLQLRSRSLVNNQRPV